MGYFGQATRARLDARQAAREVPRSAGVVAGVGQRVLSGVAKNIVGRFFKALEKHIAAAREGDGRAA